MALAQTAQHGDKLIALARASVDGFRSLSLSADGGSTDDVGGAFCWYSSSYLPVFNGAGIFDEGLINEETLGAIARYFAARARPYCIMTMDALLPGAYHLLSALGYAEYDFMPAMWLDGSPGLQPPSNRELRVTQVTAPGELAAFRAILGQVFRIPALEINLVMGERTLRVPKVHHYLGWLDDVPIATTTLVLNAQVGGVWNVGTLAPYRRRGVAAGMMRHAIAESLRLGYDSTMLLASFEGQPLYEQMGYHTLSTIRVFVPTHNET